MKNISLSQNDLYEVETLKTLFISFPSLYEAKDLRNPDKAQLVEVIRNHVTPTSDDAVLERSQLRITTF